MKERLTGAIILVVLIVLLVPELLSGPKGSAAAPPAPGAASPSSEEPQLRSYTINLGDEHSQSETANGAARSAGPPQPQQSGPAQPIAQATMPDKDLTESSSWDNPATSDSQTSSTAGAPSTSGGDSNSVLPAKPAVAPTPREAARIEPPKRAHMAGADKAGGKPHTAAASTAGPESGGWAVQLGVFAGRENAERLALDVRAKGFKASVSPFTSGSRKLYRVRVGPAADRSAAQHLQAKLKAAGQPSGTVVPHS